MILKKSVAKLQERMQTMDSILSLHPDFMYLFGEDRRFIFVNKSLLDLWGVKLEDAVGKNFADLNYPEHLAQKLDNEIARALLGETIHTEVEYTNTLGKIGNYEYIFAPVFDENAKIVAVSGTTRDITKRKLEEKEIEQAHISIKDSTETIANERENFRNLFKQTPEMVCILRGPEHRFEFVNEAHIKALGFDATGRTVREAQPESVEVYDILDKVYQTGVTAELFEIPVTLGNRLRHFNLTYSASRDPNGQTNGVMVLGMEVTDQVLTREILKSQNQALEMMMNGAPFEEVLALLAKAVEHHIDNQVRASILLLDGDKKHLVHGAGPSLPDGYNKAMNGVAIGENVGSCGTAAFLNKEVLVTDISTDPRWFEFRDLAAKHGLKSCWSTPIRSSRGELIGTFALYNRPPVAPDSYEHQVVHLITHTAALVIERHLDAKLRLVAESALKESESRYRASEEQLGLAIEVAKVGFYDWNIPEDRVTFSPQMLKDWDVDHAIENLEDAVSYIHPEDQQRVHQLINDAMENNVEFHTEYRVRQKNGSYHWMDVRGQVHRDENGNPVRFFGTCIVKTDQKTKEEDLRQAQVAAERANSAKGIFLANMSHEIRTPLGAIMGFLDLLKNPENTREDLKDYIGIIDRNSKQLLRIVDDVLDLSKIEAGKFVIENIQFSLIELLTDFSSLMSFKAREKGLNYELKLQSELPDAVQGDPTRIRQILSNIVGNAIKFTEKGFVHLGVSYSQEKLIFSVEDSGCGIDPIFVRKLFQPFSQADSSTTRLYGGTGLGLSLTKRLSEALGGIFELTHTKIGEGSTFAVKLPLKTLANTKMISSSEIKQNFKVDDVNRAEAQPLKGTRILIVDDSEDNLALMKIVLQRWGAETALASNGLDALAASQFQVFDIILMDVQMPGIDGHEATRRLRARGYCQPIVALTAHAMKEERLRCQESGFSAFLSKPIDKANLLGLLVELKSTRAGASSQTLN